MSYQNKRISPKELKSKEKAPDGPSTVAFTATKIQKKPSVHGKEMDDDGER